MEDWGKQTDSAEDDDDDDDKEGLLLFCTSLVFVRMLFHFALDVTFCPRIE